jgi:hypothetical protein
MTYTTFKVHRTSSSAVVGWGAFSNLHPSEEEDVGSLLFIGFFENRKKTV